MAFWSDTSLDPKRQFKFKVTFGRLGSPDSTFLAQSAGRPQFTISDATKVFFLEKEFSFPGKVTWEPVTIKFVDAVQANVSKDSYNYLRSSGWVEPQNVGGQTPNFATPSKAKANVAAGLVQVQVLDSQGIAVDTWTLNNAFITKVVLNELDYAAEGILTATYTFRYDWATIL